MGRIDFPVVFSTLASLSVKHFKVYLPSLEYDCSVV